MTGCGDALAPVASDLQEMRDATNLWQHTVMSAWRASLEQRGPISAKLIELVQQRRAAPCGL